MLSLMVEISKYLCERCSGWLTLQLLPYNDWASTGDGGKPHPYKPYVIVRRIFLYGRAKKKARPWSIWL
jgi:hypothetical protein